MPRVLNHDHLRRMAIRRRRIDDVAEMLSEDMSLPEIASRLGCALRTVQGDFAAIRRKLGEQSQ